MSPFMDILAQVCLASIAIAGTALLVAVAVKGVWAMCKGIFY